MAQKSIFTIFQEAYDNLMLIEKECIIDEEEELFFNHIYKYLGNLEARYNTQIHKIRNMTDLSEKDKRIVENYQGLLLKMQIETAKVANEFAKLLK